MARDIEVHFSLRVRINGYFGASGQKSDPIIRSGDLYFPQYGNRSFSLRFTDFSGACTLILLPS